MERSDLCGLRTNFSQVSSIPDVALMEELIEVSAAAAGIPPLDGSEALTFAGEEEEVTPEVDIRRLSSSTRDYQNSDTVILRRFFDFDFFQPFSLRQSKLKKWGFTAKSTIF